MAEWLVPFKGRNTSGPYNQNFLWREGNIYVMDNHRAALWCWVQHMKEDERINLLHIDRHRDTLLSRINTWVQACPDLWAVTISEYLEYKDSGLRVPLLRWDNYASIFLKMYGANVERTLFATHDEGDKFNQPHLQECQPWEIPGNLEYWIKNEKAPWICNIDLDYFVYLSSNKVDSDEMDEGSVYKELFSTAYYSEVFLAIRQQLHSGKIKVLTLCLSPEFCGGWEASEILCKKVCDVLGIDFSLPADSVAR